MEMNGWIAVITTVAQIIQHLLAHYAKTPTPLGNCIATDYDYALLHSVPNVQHNTLLSLFMIFNRLNAYH